MEYENFLHRNYSDDPVQYRINVFNEVRDYQYAINEVFSWEELLEKRRGGCGAKNRLLAKAYEELGYECQLCYTPYSWSDFEQIPIKLRNGTIFDRIGLHVFLKIKLDDWVTIDASYDKGLSGVFPVNLDWDGRSDQTVAVKVKEVCCPKNKEELAEFRARSGCSPNETPKPEETKWIKDFNAWLDETRSS